MICSFFVLPLKQLQQAGSGDVVAELLSLSEPGEEPANTWLAKDLISACENDHL